MMTAQGFGGPDTTNKPEYRFVGTIVDANTGEVVSKSSTYIMPDSVTADGECESVQIDVASLLRGFRRKDRAVFEALHYPQEGDNE